MNVLVYSGLGTTIESVRHCLATFKRFLSPHYAVAPIGSDDIIKGQWLSTCALLCLPGGADLGFCRALDGAGNRYIKQYVRRGGRFVGFCAGAYFASAEIEFEKGDLSLEVAGTRELAFFPGQCHGAAYTGFEYNSEVGARACVLNVSGRLLDMGAPSKFTSYYNGGGVFVDAEKYSDRGIEILARYQEHPDIQHKGNVAAVGCNIGTGYAFLIGTHPEFAIGDLKEYPRFKLCPELVSALEADDSSRIKFLVSFLGLLGLKCSSGEELIPLVLSNLHLSCVKPGDVQEIVGSLAELVDTKKSGYEHKTIIGENDIFIIEDKGTSTPPPSPTSSLNPDPSEPWQYQKPVFRIRIHDKHHSTKETPYFDGAKYFQYLLEEYSLSPRTLNFGTPLLYGEVVTSTNTLLEKNFNFLQKLPSGFTVVATRQTAGRGRGSNVWVSPLGALLFTTVVRHPLKYNPTAPVVFVQYLAALAIVVSIKNYGTGYEKIPVYIKWPNDIYAGVIPQEGCQMKEGLQKIGGILVNANFARDEFFLAIGCGINVTNTAPTTSLKALAESAEPPLSACEHERLLAKVLVTFETFYRKFLNSGFKAFETDYYNHWLHSDQVVILEDVTRTKAQIRGVSTDNGMLIVDELDECEKRTGKSFELQTDGNSFDFFNGLLRKRT